MKEKFEAKLTAQGPGGAWTFLYIPFSVEEVFGSRARVSVSGTINGFPFRNSLLPMGGGTHRMAVSREMQAGAKAAAGDTVKVTMEVDRAERTIEVPKELEQALKKNKKAAEFFSSLSYSHKRAYTDWVGGAKQEATRASRAAKAIEMLAAGIKNQR
jgi:hypothetical protein